MDIFEYHNYVGYDYYAKIKKKYHFLSLIVRLMISISSVV